MALTATATRRTRRVPPERLPQIELAPVLALRNPMHALLEVDVTAARRGLADLARTSGERWSFTAFVVACLARAVHEQRAVQAFRRGRRLIVFDEVDVATLVEVETGGRRFPLPYVIRDAATKPLAELHREIRAVQTDPASLVARVRRQVGLLAWVPGPVRLLLWRGLARSPRLRRRFGGTVVVTSVGMFAPGGRAWGLGLVSYPVTVTIGAIGPARDGHGETLCLTVSLDHEAVDGGPAGRFVARLRELLEQGLPGDAEAGRARPAGAGAARDPVVQTASSQKGRPRPS